MMVDLPNVQSVLFKEHEGSFLVGVLAALASKSGKIGFVGGYGYPADPPLPVRLRAGHQVRQPKAELIANMTGTTPAAWNDPGRGAELAKGQFDRGVRRGLRRRRQHRHRRVAGRQGSRQVRDRRRFQPELPASGTMLTSMIKHVDVAAYQSFKAAQDGSWKGGLQVLGLKEGGVNWAYDQYNEKLVTPDMKAKVEQAKADIISGKIVVHDYMSNNACK
jgi:basic membrane protein A